MLPPAIFGTFISSLFSQSSTSSTLRFPELWMPLCFKYSFNQGTGLQWKLPAAESAILCPLSLAYMRLPSSQECAVKNIERTLLFSNVVAWFFGYSKIPINSWKRQKMGIDFKERFYQEVIKKDNSHRRKRKAGERWSVDRRYGMGNKKLMKRNVKRKTKPNNNMSNGDTLEHYTSSYITVPR